MNSATTAVHNKTKTTRKPFTGCRWSGDEEESQSYYNREDDDTGTLTVGEQRRIQGYHANAQRKWRNSDEDDNQRVVAAAQAIVRSIRRDMNLTKEQRADKSEQFKFGLCSDCDAGLGDESDFVCEPSRPTGAFVMRCNACYDHYQQVWLKRLDCECAGCN